MTRRSIRASARHGARLAAALLLSLFVTGCAFFYQDPTVRIVDVRVVGLGITSGTAEVTLEVDNPNRFGMEVRAFHYLLEVADGPDRWAELARGEADEAVEIPRRSVQEVTLSVPFQYRAAGSALRAWLETGSIGYRMRGELTARAPTRTMVFPVRSEGTIVP